MAWSFGKRLQHARIERGVSQRSLAALTGLRQSHLSMLENRHHLPNAGVVRRIAHALHINGDYLLGLTTEMCVVDYGELEEESDNVAATADVA